MAKKKLQVLDFKHIQGVLIPFSENSISVVADLPKDETVLVEIKNYSKKDLRSIAQNRLMWSWFKDAQDTKNNEHSGMTTDEWHLIMKRKFLLVIYERDSLAWGETLEALRNVYRYGLKVEAEKLIDNIVNNELSTTEATPEQFCEYLSSIERYFHDAGVFLRTDPVMYKSAFGL